MRNGLEHFFEDVPEAGGEGGPPKGAPSFSRTRSRPSPGETCKSGRATLPRASTKGRQDGWQVKHVKLYFGPV